MPHANFGSGPLVIWENSVCRGSAIVASDEALKFLSRLSLLSKPLSEAVLATICNAGIWGAASLRKIGELYWVPLGSTR